MLKALLFQIAKAPWMGKIVGTAFRYFSWLIPVKKLGNHRDVIVFHHPKPCYENHLILSPKRAIRDLPQLANEENARYCAAIWDAFTELLQPVYSNASVLIANGGHRQEVQQVHFHLFTGCEMVNPYFPQAQEEPPFYRDSRIVILKHPCPNQEIHYVIKPMSPAHDEGHSEGKRACLADILRGISLLDAQYHIIEKGYSLICQFDRQHPEWDQPVFHIVAGSLKDEQENE